MERQRDFDFIDEDGLKSDVVVENGGLRNRSGQSYTALILPPLRFLSAQALERISSFAAAGGRVLFAGGAPESIVDRSYQDGIPGKKHAFFRDPPANVTLLERFDVGVLDNLPRADVLLSPAAPEVKYLRRSLQDAEVYFFFNEGNQKIETMASLEGAGGAELWDAQTGQRAALPSTRADGMVKLPLWLEPYATAVVILREGGVQDNIAHPHRLRAISKLDGNWELKLEGKSMTGPLRPWSDLGMSGYWGEGMYQKSFRYTGPVPEGGLWLDLGEVRYAAHVWLNGRDLGPRAWGPYRWEVSDAIRPGENTLQVEVANTRANELAGDAARFNEIEKRGWLKNSYVKMYLKFDQEMVPSGLIGPVILATAERAQ
jgi:hypothetical protein